MRARRFVLVLAGLSALAMASPASPARAKPIAKQGVKAQVKRGTLTVTGNRRANRVELRLKRHRGRILEVDVGKAGKAEFSFRRRAFKRIVVRGGSGADTLAVSERNGSFFRSERTSLDGGRGVDRIAFNGSRRNDSIALSRNRRRLQIARHTAPAATFSVVARRLEAVTVTPLGGADTITFGDLTGTGVRDASVGLGSRGRGDGAPDTIFAGATDGPDALSMSGSGTDRILEGIPWSVRASNAEPGSDRFIAVGRGGADTLTLAGTEGADNAGIAGVDGLMRAAVNGAVFHSDEVEALRFNALGGADSVAVDDLGGSVPGATDVSQVALDLGSAPTAGGDGAADGVAVNGGPGAENLAATSGPAGVAVTGLATTVSVAAPEAGDHLTLNGAGGNDSVNTLGVSPGIVGLTLRGGPDTDTLTGGPADEGFALLPGDGSDVAEGGAGADRAEVGGSDAADQISSAAPGAGRALFHSGPDAALDTNDVESAALVPSTGADAVRVGDMTGSDVTRVEARLAASGGAGDNGSDTVTVDGTPGDDALAVTSPDDVVVSGLPVSMTVTGAEPALDRLVVASGSGGDVVNAISLAVNRISLVVEGGVGNDGVFGSPGDDTIQGQDGDDSLFLGAGNDTALWNPGDDNDVLEGQGGADRLVMNGAGVNEGFDVSANGGRVLVLRDVANVALDANDIEAVELHLLAGVDSVNVNNLAGTDVVRVDVGLAGSNGAADTQDDQVFQFGTNGADVISLAGGPDGVTSSGLAAVVGVTGADPGFDDLIVVAAGGNDSVDASDVRVGGPKLTLNGSDGNDDLTGGDGDDFLIGGPDDDVMRGGPGIDNFDGSEGSDTVIQD